MLTALYKVEAKLPSLLNTAEGWNSLCIDYHKPFVERLWRDFGEYRISLHRISACNDGEALYHPHPWPSAMRIVSGAYEMGVGYSETDVAPKTAAKLILPAGAAYEMSEPDGWHYVRPLTPDTLSVMVTGKPWGRKSPKSSRQLRPLRQSTVIELVSVFRSHYS